MFNTLAALKPIEQRFIFVLDLNWSSIWSFNCVNSKVIFNKKITILLKINL